MCPEATRDLIESYYQSILHRNGDAAGLDAWMANLRGGMTDQEVHAAFFASNEFLTKL